MKCEFEDALLGSGSIMRKTSSFFAENGGKAIAAITGVVAVLLSFTNVGFYDFRAVEFTTNLAVLLLCSYVIFFSLEDAGERLGKESAEYLSALEEYGALTRKLSGSDVPLLREFCMSYKADELRYRQDSLLLSCALSREDMERYKKGEKFSLRERLVLKKAIKMKAVALTPGYLLGGMADKNGKELKNPQRYKFLRLFLEMLPSAICTVFTVSVMLSGKEMTVAAVIESIFKLSCLPVIGLRGYTRGYAYVSEELTPWVKTKSRLLEAFIAKLPG